MHMLKGGWVGQTFALAKSNESGGKKSRIRRSKEERKGMVESFIKKYQSLNNGSFPSLNLTHKEVGGSFYTVREIVREIIQENRVLGPAKLLPGEDNANVSLDQYPLGTISTDPQISLSMSTKGDPFEPYQYQSTSEEPNIVSNGRYAETEEQEVANMHIINGSQVILGNGQSDNPEVTEVQVNEKQETEKGKKELVESSHVIAEVQASEPLKAEADVEEFVSSSTTVLGQEVQLSESQKSAENVETFASSTAKVMSEEVQLSEMLEINRSEAKISQAEVSVVEVQVSEPIDSGAQAKELTNSTAKVAEMTDVIVESFPLRSIGKLNDYLNGCSSEVKNRNGTLGKSAVENVLSKTISNNNLQDGLKFTEDSTIVDDKEVKVGDNKAVNKVADAMSSSNSSTTNGSVMHNNQGSTEENNIADAEIKDACASNHSHAVTPKNVDTCNNNSTQEEVVIEKRAREKDNGSFEQGSNPTLDRVRIESWKGAPTANSVEQQTNKLWMIFKSFISAFVNIWRE